MLRRLLLLFFIILQLNNNNIMVYGFPTLIVDSSKAKCISIEGTLDTIIKIKYDAPDLIIDESTVGYMPTYITINTIPSKRVLDTVLHMSPIKSRLKPTSQTLSNRTGIIYHQIEVDGTAVICIRSTMANKKHVQRFSLHIETNINDSTITLPKNYYKNKENKKLIQEPEIKVDVDEHLSYMEMEIQRILIHMNHILKEAEFNKDQDTLFHKQTLAMHSATTFWPIVQVCILLATGFTQANHIIQFFKSRRII